MAWRRVAPIRESFDEGQGLWITRSFENRSRARYSPDLPATPIYISTVP